MTKHNAIYKDIPEYEGLYSVSDKGDVVSHKREVYTGSGDRRRKITLKEKLLNPNDRNGYKFVNLRKDGKSKTVGVHQLVLWAFVGKQQKGIEVRHLNSNPSDNRLENLAYGTKSENMQDAVKLGTLVFSRSKLTVEDVKGIARHKGSLKQIAEIYNCGTGTVQAIKTGKSFKGFAGNINYTERVRKKLSRETLNFIRDRNNSRPEIVKKTGLTINQVKRIRKGQDFIYASK